jgi:hypothetical protein
MGLKESSPMSLDERLSHDAHNNVVYANFEGMNIKTEEEADKLADYLDRYFSTLGRKVHVVVSSSESTATSMRRARACECGICSSLARIARLRGSAGWYGRVRSGQAAAANSVKCVQNTVIWAAKVEHLGGPLQREECLLHPAPINNELSGGAPVPQTSGPELNGASRSADAG